MNNTVTSAREKRGFLSVANLLEKLGKENAILDASVLVAENVEMGKGNIFYPNVVIECNDGGKINIGDNNVFYPGTYIVSTGGSIRIGHMNTFGNNGCSIKANMPTSTIIVGNGGRYTDGANIMGRSTLGDGSQILGNITVQNCHLGAGGTYKVSDPDERAAVLKGFGLARDINLKKGQVINGSGNFANAAIEWQRAYHPK